MSLATNSRLPVPGIISPFLDPISFSILGYDKALKCQFLTVLSHVRQSCCLVLWGVCHVSFKVGLVLLNFCFCSLFKNAFSFWDCVQSLVINYNE